MKLHDRNPRYTMMADKYEVKKYIASVIGEQYVVSCYGVWNRFEDIDFNALPSEFVLKTTHDSSGVTICRNKAELNFPLLRKRFEKYLTHNNYSWGKEWVYKNIQPRIIADKLLDDHSGHELRDYKFWCFNGVPRIMYCTNKAESIFENFYDMDFNPVDINHGFERHKPEFEKPFGFEIMKSLSARLAADIPFVRIDFFEVEKRIYFGEFTFYDWAGLQPFVDDEWDKRLGDWIKLPCDS